MDQRVNGEESTQRSVGMTGSLNYMYDQRFSVDFNIRGDLSSQFGADTKMAPFWSVGLRWNMEREKWLEGSIISNLTLFGSVGTTGSQSYSPYQAKETYSFGDLMFPYPSGDVLGAQLMAIGNPDLGWSKTMQKSVSLEFGLWNSRLNATVSYYHNYTDEMLLGTNIQPSTGFSTLTRNVGAVLNEGVDVSLNGLLINNYENLLVVQTFSKSRQLAGARLGLAMGNAKLIADLNRVKFSLNPYNINRLTLKAGKAALEDTDYFDKTRAAIVETRGWTKQQLEARGFAVLDSRSNFLFASTDKKSGGELYLKLKEKGVLVRHFDAPRISNWLRITIGTPDDMTALLRALDEILEG